MARRAQATTGHTNGATTADTPPAGPSQSRRSEVLAEYTRLTTEGQRVNQAKSTLLTAFTKEGGDTKALKSLHASLKLDPAEAAAKLTTLVQYHAGVNIKVKFGDDGQGSVLDDLGPEQPTPPSDGDKLLSVARAHSDGYNCGRSGATPSDNPFQHQIGSEEYVNWHNGRDEGQADRLKRRPALEARVAASATADAAMPPNTGVFPPS